MRMGADWARIGTLSRNRYFSALQQEFTFTDMLDALTNVRFW